MYCPKCKSDEIEATSLTYPRTFECKNCKHVFLTLPKLMIDE